MVKIVMRQLPLLHYYGRRKNNKASDPISTMLNGIRYYSLELVIDQNYYRIQAFEQEAIDLYDMAMTILNDKNRIRCMRGCLCLEMTT